MKKTELIKGILELGESLKDAEGMGALVDINEMELLVDKYVQELGQTLPIDSVIKCDYCGDTGRVEPTLQYPDGIKCYKCP